ncbi:MAG TPA: hypothetical protein PKD53_00940 [Chloroflexaceae bacterium]|nr:hypothetical protein [Chloroflexaceae bacterium]
MTSLLWCGAALVVLFVAVAVAIPVSVLTWWAGWSRRAGPATPVPPPAALPAAAPAAGPFLVYLSGVGDISGEYQTRYEDDMLAAVAARVPGLVVIEDVFAYSVENMSMTSQRQLGWFWAWVNAVRLRKDSPIKRLGKLINLRNMLHIAVSADRRYGPIYNYGVAEMILQGLVRHGYVPGSGAPVTLLGYSGGGQIALATAGYVQATLRAPVQVVSLAGIMNSSSSLATISAVTHLYGTEDRGQRLGDLIFPARWPLFPGSHWGQALAKGRLRLVCLGPMRHSGRGSYLDATMRVADGRSYLDVTSDAIAELLLLLR